MNAIERDQPGGSQLAATATDGTAPDAINCVPPVGGSQLAATATGGTAADAINCVPSVGGSQLAATVTRGPAADAINCVPPVLPVRHHPSRNSVMTFHDNRAIMLYVTIVTANRMPVLACAAVTECILAAWAAATDWLVGRYVIMPDHIHFFCAPASYPPPDFHRWMKRWKSLATLATRRSGGSQLAATEVGIAGAINCAPPGGGSQLAATVAKGSVAGAINCAPPGGGSQLAATVARGSVADAMNCVPPRNPPLWQRNCWDRQLRTGESYSQKWEYVRNNPVRRGLVTCADDWPYQGELNVLEWHERN